VSRVCTICQHKRRADIDRALVSGRAISKIALEFNVPEYSVRYHAENHLSRQLLKANEIREAINTETIAKTFLDLMDRTERLLQRAEESPNLFAQASAIREMRSNLEFLAKWAVTMKQRLQEQQEQEAQAQGETLDQALRRLDPLGLKLYRVLMRHFQGHSIESGLQSLFRELNIHAPARPQQERSSPEIQPDPVHQEPSDQEQQSEEDPPPKAVRRPRTNPPPRHLEGGGRLYHGPSEPEDHSSPENKRERDGAKHLHAALVGGFELGKLPG